MSVILGIPCITQNLSSELDEAVPAEISNASYPQFPALITSSHTNLICSRRENAIIPCVCRMGWGGLLGEVPEQVHKDKCYTKMLDKDLSKNIP